MHYLWAILGAVIGALVGNWMGALAGAGLGHGLWRMHLSGRELRDQVRTLREQMAALQGELRRLNEASTMPVPGAAPGPSPDPAFFEALEVPIVAQRVAPPDPADLEPLHIDTVPVAPYDDAEDVPMPQPELAAMPATAAPPSLPPDGLDWPDDEGPQAASPPRPATPAPAPAARRPVPRAIPPAAPPTDWKDLVPARWQPWIFGGNTIVKVGVLILFLGLAFLLRYVSEQVTVPVEMRYLSVALLGSALLVLGWRLRDRPDAQGGTGYGLILQGAGVGVFYLTTLAAMKLHPLLPVPAGFAIMAAVTAFSALLAVAQNAPWLAMVAASAGFATPVLVSTGGGNHIALFSYLAILDLGIVAMAWFKAWRALNLIGFVGTFTLASAWALDHYTEAVYPSTQAFLLLFFAMFTTIGVLFARRALALGDEPAAQGTLADRAAQALRQVGRVDSTLVFGVPLATYGLQYQMVQHDPWWPAWSALLLGLFEVALGAWLWRSGRVRYALLGEAYVVVGVLFGTLSVPLALEGAWTGATWAVEAAGMYWLGTRQHRAYTRGFALVLLAFAAARTFSSLGWSDQPDGPVIVGSWLSLVLLAGSSLAMALVHRRANASTATPALEDEARWDAPGAQLSWALGALALAVLPWVLLAPIGASVVTSLVAAVCAGGSSRLRLPVLGLASVALHATALAGFVSTWHQVDGELMLDSGPRGVVAAVLIAVSLLATAWFSMRETWSGAAQTGAAAGQHPPAWSVGSGVALFVGVGLASAAFLFMMPVAQAVLVWPVLGLVALWLGLKMAHPGLTWAWAALTVLSALAFLSVGEPLWSTWVGSPDPATWQGLLGGLAWWTPLVLTLTGIVAGDSLQEAARPTARWSQPWTRLATVQWGAVAWGLWWWALATLPELDRQLHAMHATDAWPSVLVLWVTLTSVWMAWLGRWRDWALMGRAATLAYPGWWLAVVTGPLSTAWPPSAQLGWVAWPLALGWHLLLLRRLPLWWPVRVMGGVHACGLWLLALLATLQVHWWLGPWAPPGSGWEALVVLVPWLLVVAVASPRWADQWPIQGFVRSYRVAGALPLVVGLAWWLLHSLGQAGQAAPLPHVPVLNPLELAQGLVLLALAAWWRSLPDDLTDRLPDPRLRWAATGGLGLALLTSMVLRACHHWAAVPWEAESLFHSRLAQAALSVTWALLGVALMLLGHRRVARPVWGVGAGLLAVVVVKLFFIELADHGGLYRIVSFIVVGLLLLMVGYFAPVPPDSRAPDKELR